MTDPFKFNSATHVISISRNLLASKTRERPDPPVPVDGMTFGVATMSENSPHGGEMHPDGDEVLYLIDGKVNVVFPESLSEDIEMRPGDGLVVPQGMWHRVDIIEPSQIVYVTPGPNNEFKPLTGDSQL